MTLYIKNMLTTRCKMVVLEVFKKLDLHANVIDLGEVEVHGDVSFEQKTQLKTDLLHMGLDLIEDKKEMIIEKIKSTIIEFVHHDEGLSKLKFSVYLSQKLNYNYAYLASLFSVLQGITIEQYIIAHKVERVKELIIYGECNITEIAWKMNYSSVAHLSNQFKKFTGLSPSRFKKLRHLKRNTLEDLGKAPCITQTPLRHSPVGIKINAASSIRT